MSQPDRRLLWVAHKALATHRLDYMYYIRSVPLHGRMHVAGNRTPSKMVGMNRVSMQELYTNRTIEYLCMMATVTSKCIVLTPSAHKLTPRTAETALM